MKPQLIAITLAATTAVASVVTVAQSQTLALAKTAAQTERVENFQLPDQRSQGHELFYYRNSPAVVIVSTTTGSKVIRAAAPALRTLASDAARNRAPVFLLNSNPADTRQQIVGEMKSLGLDLPVLIDDTQIVGESLGVTREAEAIVVNPRTWMIVYRGPLGQSFTGKGGKSGSADYVAAAVQSLVEGQPVSIKAAKLETPEIAFPLRDNAASFSKISYEKEIAPIVADNCVACHAEGGIGPVAFDSYEKIKGFAPMIREAIRTDRMPPYGADRHVGKFNNDMNLSAHEQQTLIHWIEAGAPRGAGSDPLKLNARPAPEWPLGPPDMITSIPAYNVPASGIVDYQTQIVDSGLAEGRWLRAWTTKPGDRKAVHHITSNTQLGYAVGEETQKAAPASGSWLAPSTKFRFSMHYTPYGKKTVDKSRIGLYFYPKDKPPEIYLRHIAIANSNIEIPPNTANHEEVAYATFPEAATLYQVSFHAHYRGASMTMGLLEPGDKVETVFFAIPKYDFNWQRAYDLAEPIRIKPGAKIVTRYFFDNSKNNPSNPDPTIAVKWGEQSWEEMQFSDIYYRWDDETVTNRKDDYQARLQASRNIGLLDVNLDDKVAKSEVRGRLAQTILTKWDTLDENKDGFLNDAELAPVSGSMQRQITQAQNFEVVTD